jgi:hypothetical protein
MREYEDNIKTDCREMEYLFMYTGIYQDKKQSLIVEVCSRF